MRIWNFISPAALIAILGIAACGGEVGTTDSASAEIAGDKTKLAALIHQSHDKGTFPSGLALAMEDSVIAEEVYAAVMANPMLSSRIAMSSTSASTTNGTGSSGSAARSSTAPKKDILDKTEENVQKANERLDQAARVKKGAEDATKKVEGIFK